MTLRHITSINDLTLEEIETVFSLADRFLADLGDPDIAHRIAKSTDVCAGSMMATLFYEPSTRTRLSFESAMLRLGGKAISSADPAASSAAKGESLADTVRVVSNYADILVLRHPRDGAAKLAAQYATVPIVSGGDGAHEHPTQTLCDLFTLRREKKTLKNLNVAIVGDLKGSRTIHSFVYALARFGANILMMPAKGMELPAHVDWRLRNEFHCIAFPGHDPLIDAIYVTACEQPQRLLWGSDLPREPKLTSDIDVLYMTRFQKERWAEATHDYPKVDSEFLRDNRFRNASVLHPLPRVGEVDVSFDQDSRAAYFRQAAYGVPIRMALVTLLLDASREFSLRKFDAGFEDDRRQLYDASPESGLACVNANCISHDPLDSQNAIPKFYVIAVKPPRLRCLYCESDIEGFVAASKRTKTYDDADETIGSADRDLAIFANSGAADMHGYSRCTRPPAKAAAR